MLGTNKSCVLCSCALKWTGTFAAESKDVFILIDFRRSDVLMFHSRHQSVCQQLFQDWEKFKFLDHVYLRHLSTECQLILSADMANDTRLIYRPTLGRYFDRVSDECRSSVGRHVVLVNRPSVDTIGRYVGRHSADMLRSTVASVSVDCR